jgi:putative transposase
MGRRYKDWGQTPMEFICPPAAGLGVIEGMARLPRIVVPGVPTHIWIRGNNRQAIFRSVGDRMYFRRCVLEMAREHEVAVHAYVWMTNHVHLLVTGARADSLAKLVQGVGRRYVPYFNFLYERTGTLWEGRFGSSPVEAERYFLICHRYVELNPVRAGMVGDPGAYEWSSFRCNALGARDELVTPHSLYMELGGDDARRQAAYRNLFAGDLDSLTLEAIRHSAHHGWALGGSEFCEFLESRCGRPAKPRARGPVAGVNSIGV